MIYGWWEGVEKSQRDEGVMHDGCLCQDVCAGMCSVVMEAP